MSSNDQEVRLINRIVIESDLNPVIERGVQPAWFQTAECKAIYAWMVSHHTKYGQVPDPKSLYANYPTFPYDPNESESLDYLLDVFMTYRDHLRAEDTIQAAAQALGKANDKDAAFAAMRSALQEHDLEMAVMAGSRDLDLTDDPLKRLDAYDQGVATAGRLLGYPTGYEKIDEATAGLQPGQLVTIIAEPKTGKAQPYDTPVLTPTGWVQMGSLLVGDEVVGPDGLSTKVVAIHEQGEIPVYRVTLDDGGTTEACGDHLWEVHPHSNKPKVVNTRELMARVQQSKRFAYLPVMEAVDYPEVDLPLDPWLVGVMIGDGSYSYGQVSLTNVDRGVLSRANEVSPVPYKTKDALHHHFTTERGKPNPFLEGLRTLGIAGQASQNKRLPDGFLMWSVVQRQSLLAGLLDTDGCLNGKSVAYYTSVEALALQVQQLVWSLGGTARLTKKPRFYTKDGDRFQGRDGYSVIMRLPYGNPFRYSERWQRYEDKPSVSRRPSRRVESVTFSRVTQARCITVAREDGLYVTEDYIVTHNSQVALRTAANIHQAGHSVLFQTFEMSNAECQVRHDAMRAHVSHNRLRRFILTPNEEGRYKAMLQSMQNLPKPMVLTDATQGITVSALAAKIDQHNPDVVFVDGLYLMVDENSGESNTPQALTNITRSLKRLSQQRKKPIVITTQVLSWKKKNNKLSADHIGYSSSFHQDSDVILGLEMVENEDELRNLRIVASRNCGPDEAFLIWRWDTGCFHDEAQASVCPGCRIHNTFQALQPGSGPAVP